MAATSCSPTNAPCTRLSVALPGGTKSMSPLPMRVSAPPRSRMVRESICEVTLKPMRVGRLALMRPVMTSVDGRCVASTRWMPAARASWAMRATEVSMSCAATIMRSAISSMMQTM